MSENLGILTSGGDAAGMNAAVKCAVEYARLRGVKPYLVFDGLRGLIDAEIRDAEQVDLSGIMQRGGTMLRTRRSKRFYEYEHRKQAAENLAGLGIGRLIVIGGDGSFRALNQFYSDFGIPFIGIPATIDNDIPGTDYCLGVDTALNVICQALDSLRDTAASMRRAFVVEVMGRECGYLAMVSSLACGAEICIVPEIEYDFEAMTRRLRERVGVQQRSVFAIVAEGTEMAGYLDRWLNETIGIESRLTVLGHVQRGGAPTVYDRIMAYRFVVSAIDALLAGESGKVVAYRRGGGFNLIPVHEVAEGKVELDPTIIELCRPLCS